MKAYYFDGHRVSKPWHVVLTHARNDGVNFLVTDGRRTMAMQRARVKKHGLWSLSNPTGAARPSLAAPHINFYRANHALDVGVGAYNLVHYLNTAGRGVHATRPIAAEEWHVQVERRGLLNYSKRILKAVH